MGKYAKLVSRVKKSVDYSAQAAMRDFVHDLIHRMDRQGMTQAKLAEVIDASPAYVSKVMRGEANFTLETMTKLAMASGGRLRVQIVDDTAANAHSTRDAADTTNRAQQGTDRFNRRSAVRGR
jgi:transcriptional regulator with XRE-family HTH domain